MTPKKAAQKKAVRKVAAKKTAVRKTPGKRAEVAPKAPAKSAARHPKTTAVRASGSRAKTDSRVTTIIAKTDIGWGNTLFLRGDGGGLSWQAGVPMDPLDGCWRWSGLATGRGIHFKVLVNDQHWCHGEDSHVAAGETIHVEPEF